MRDIGFIIALVFIGFGVFFGGACVGYEMGQRRGQIDAQAGKIRYYLVDCPDGERRWADKENPEEACKP